MNIHTDGKVTAHAKYYCLHDVCLHSCSVSLFFAVLGKSPVMKDLLSKVARRLPTKWFEIGIQLDLDLPTLEALEEQTSDHIRLYAKVFDHWKKEQNVPYTWSSIINALRAIEENKAAEDISEWLSGTDDH